MSGKMRRLLKAYVLLGLILLAGNTIQANWSENFDGNAFDLAAWRSSAIRTLQNKINL